MFGLFAPLAARLQSPFVKGQKIAMVEMHQTSFHHKIIVESVDAVQDIQRVRQLFTVQFDAHILMMVISHREVKFL